MSQETQQVVSVGPAAVERGKGPLLAGWKSLLLVAAVAFINAVSFQGSRGLYETTEGRYAECARETLRSGDIDDPILQGAPHWTKPPATYVAIMAGMRAFGENPWGVRAYLVAAMVLAAAAVWWAGTAIWGPAAGRWAGIVFATSPAIAAIAHSVSADMLVVLWTALAMAAFWHGRATRSRWAAPLAWAFAGMGCLTKGPPALLVPLVTLGGAWVLLRRAKSWQPGPWTALSGIALFLAIGFGWFASEAVENPGLLAYWFGRELLARNLTGEFHRNPGWNYVFFVYVPMLLLGTGPWLVLAMFRWRRSFRGWPLFRSNPATWNGAANWSLIAGVILPFLVFAASRSRLAGYLAPLFVPLSLLLGRGLECLLTRGRMTQRTAIGIAGVLVVLIVGLKALAAIPETANDMTRLAQRLEPVLARNPADLLFSVGNGTLHGLEFHLRRDVEPVAPTHFAVRLRQAGTIGAHPLFLVKKKNWARLATNLAVGIHVEDLGPRWVGIRPAADP